MLSLATRGLAHMERSWHPYSVLLLASSADRVAGFEEVLQEKGYAVSRETCEPAVVDHACASRPDAVIVESRAPGHVGLDVCRLLVGDPRFSATTPILLVTDDGAASLRHAALQAGAWDVFADPLDMATVLLKLRTYVRVHVSGERRVAVPLVERLGF